MARSLVSPSLLDAISDALSLNANNVRRIVIDIQAGELPLVHVEQFGDDRIIEVVRALGGVEVKYAAKGDTA